jgi:hypothetical protein
MRGWGWLALSVVAGLAVGGLIVASTHSSFSGPLVGIVLLLIVVVLLAGVPWLALRPSAWWWLASVAGVVVGIFVGLVVLVSLLKVVTLCFLPPCAGAPSSPYAGALLLVVPLAVMGVAQTLVLKGFRRRIGWLVTALIAAVVFPEGVNVAASLLGENPNNPALIAVLVAGAVWGVVVGLGLLWLTSPELA